MSLAVVAITTLPSAGPAAAHTAVGSTGAMGSTVAAGQGMTMPHGAGGTAVGNGQDRAVIYRDRYGVPSIVAGNTAGMWFGAGWAQAQDRMVQLELTRRAVEGTLSAILGKAELGQDETVRTLFYTPAELRAQYLSLPSATRAALVAYSNGINAYEASAYASAASEKADVPYEFFVLGKLLGESGPYRPAPWQPIDTVAVGNYLAREFGGGGGSELQNFQFLEYLASDAGGMYITGEPFLLIGRNGRIAWTTTSEELVDQRIYVENVDFKASPPTYNFDGKQIPMQAIKEKIPVAGSKPVGFTVYRTIDGPVISTTPSIGLAFSLRFASWDKETGSLLGFSQLGGDQDLAQFRHSMSLITTIHNFMYADDRGNIAYFGDGLIPIEPSFSKVDPRLPALGNGTEQWKGFVPFAQMPHSVNPPQGYLDNWNTKPSQRFFYQQNEGDEYWGTIFRSQLIATMAAASTHITIAYLEGIEHAIGTIDNEDNTRPAAPYFIPFLVSAYKKLLAGHSPLTDPATHPDLARAVSVLAKWNDVSTLGSPAMSIFMNYLEAVERNVFEGGTFSGEQYTGKLNFDDASYGYGTYGGLGGMGTYNLLYHILAGTHGLVPCGTLCYTGGYFGGHTDQILVESLNDAITILSGTGTQLGQQVPGFGTADIANWGYQPAQDQDWDDLDPLAAGVTTHCGTSASQNRSTFMMAVDVGPVVTGQDELPPGQSGFISAAGTPSPHLCDQVGLFNTFRYKPMPAAWPGSAAPARHRAVRP